MPRRNSGTLIENIALVAAARACLNRAEELQFATSFAMPPMTPWIDKDQGSLTGDKITKPSRLPWGESPRFTQIFRRCANRKNGPNGAVFVSVQAAMRKRALRAWVNDFEDDPSEQYQKEYGEVRGCDLQGVVSGIVEKEWSPKSLTYNPGAYPSTIAEGESSLAQTIEQWTRESEGPYCRLGYLDPNEHSKETGDGLNTTDDDVADWFKCLTKADPLLSLHVHFSSSRGRVSHEKALNGLMAVANSSGFGASICLIHGKHAVVLAAKTDTESPVAVLEGILSEFDRQWLCWQDRNKLLRVFGSFSRPEGG